MNKNIQNSKFNIPVFQIPNSSSNTGNLADVFQKRLQQLGIKRQVDAAMICETFDSSVLDVFGEKGQKNVRAISYKKGVLKVGVTSSAWASEINLKQIKLLSDEKMRIIYRAISQKNL